MAAQANNQTAYMIRPTEWSDTIIRAQNLAPAKARVRLHAGLLLLLPIADCRLSIGKLGTRKAELRTEFVLNARRLTLSAASGHLPFTIYDLPIRTPSAQRLNASGHLPFTIYDLPIRTPNTRTPQHPNTSPIKQPSNQKPSNPAPGGAA